MRFHNEITLLLKKAHLFLDVFTSLNHFYHALLLLKNKQINIIFKKFRENFKTCLRNFKT
jgi:hypothetical protein